MLACTAGSLAFAVASTLLTHAHHMENHQDVIEVRRFQRGGRVIRVLFTRNSRRSVSGRLLIGDGDTPIIDGPTPDAVMDLARDVWDAFALARGEAA